MKFNLPAYTTNYFSTKIWVQCPKCNKKALVTSKPSKCVLPINNEAQINCTSCSFKKESSDDWSGFFQGFIKQSCGFCGTEITHSTKPTIELLNKVNVKCTTCKKVKEYELLWAPFRSSKATDPYFGYNLWLQTNVKNNVLWGYNKEHLQYLRAYVVATLREDNNRCIYSLIANLPQWIIIAKNREVVVKKLNKLIAAT